MFKDGGVLIVRTRVKNQALAGGGDSTGTPGWMAGINRTGPPKKQRSLVAHMELTFCNRDRIKKDELFRNCVIFFIDKLKSLNYQKRPRKTQCNRKLKMQSMKQTTTHISDVRVCRICL
jgi:hypothetical protein